MAKEKGNKVVSQRDSRKFSSHEDMRETGNKGSITKNRGRDLRNALRESEENYSYFDDDDEV
jgi:hypothetical protein